MVDMDRRDKPKRSYEQDRNHDSNKKSRDDKNYYGPGDQQWGKEEPKETKEDGPEEPKIKPNFGLSGALAKDEATGNSVNGVVLKYNIPADAAIPDRKWRLYVFKDDKIVDTLYIHRKNSYLAGRDQRVADIEVAHPSASKQHAVIHFRKIEKTSRDGDTYEKIIPYLMDLGSVHKTLLNGAVIDDSRYYELREKDVIKFGGSTREYVLMHDDSKDD